MAVEFQCTSQTSDELQPIGIYVHVPFCEHRCSYCDFYTFTGHSSAQGKAWLEAVLRELKSAALWLAKAGRRYEVDTVFVGGGTPSLISARDLAQILDTLSQDFRCSAAMEMTCEANPESLTEDWCRDLVGQGVNRFSLGVQSFLPQHLKTLDRKASPADVERGIDVLRACGVARYNLDLIFGIPHQTVAEVLADVDRASSLFPDHISFYQLTLKPGHPLYARLPGEEVLLEMYEEGRLRLEKLGYRRYEISNFSKVGGECRHNLLYWDGGDFLGVGPSSASRFFWDNAFVHRKQVSAFDRYLAEPDFLDRSLEWTTPEQTRLEALFLELRKTEGIHLDPFRRRYGWTPERATKTQRFEKEGFLIRGEGRLRLTDKGLNILETIAVELASY